MSDKSDRPYPDQYMMRFPAGMRDQLKAAARSNGRALNAEIIARLEAYDEMQMQLKQTMEALEETQKLANLHKIFRKSAYKEVERTHRELKLTKSKLGQTHELFDAAVSQVRNYYISIWKILVDRLPSFVNSLEVAATCLDENNPNLAKKIILDLHDNIEQFSNLDIFKELPPEHKKNEDTELHDPMAGSYVTDVDPDPFDD